MTRDDWFNRYNNRDRRDFSIPPVGVSQQAPKAVIGRKIRAHWHTIGDRRSGWVKNARFASPERVLADRLQQIGEGLI